MKKFFAILSIAALVFAACEPNNTDEPQLPSAAGITPVVTVAENVATFSLPEGITGLIPVWYTNESGDFVFAGNGNNFTKTFFENGTFKVRMYVSNANGQSKDYSEADFTINATMEWNGYNYNSEYNLWKAAEGEAANTYTWYAPNWAEVAGHSAAVSSGIYTVSFPTACAGQWQAQVHIVPDGTIALTADKHYDFSCIVNVNKDCGGVTFKFVEQGGDQTSNGGINHDEIFLFVEQQDLKAGENIFYMKDVPGLALSPAKMVFDFGWCAENTQVTISRITLKDHANDDGTNAPDKEKSEPEPEAEPADYQISAATNLWRSATLTVAPWFSGSDWQGGLNLVYEWADNNYDLSLTIPDGIGGSEWMGQVQIQTNIPCSQDKRYDFCATVEADADFTYTVKLGKLGDDIAHAIVYDPNQKVENGVGQVDLPYLATDGIDYEALTVFFDFGRTAAGTHVTIKDVCFQEHIKKN